MPATATATHSRTAADTDFEWFERNMPALYKRHGHKFLAIKGRRVLGAYGTFEAALGDTLKTQAMGTFLIQECFKTVEESVLHFQGNVAFADR